MWCPPGGGAASSDGGDEESGVSSGGAASHTEPSLRASSTDGGDVAGMFHGTKGVSSRASIAALSLDVCRMC